MPNFFYLFSICSLILLFWFIIRKYEEIKPKNVADFVDITDNTYSQQEVVKMEADLLKTLKFEMGSPTVKTFLG